MATRLAEHACLTNDLPANDLVLVRFGTNAVFKVGGADVALRLRRPGTPAEEIARQVDLATWLAGNGFPVNHPAPGLEVTDEGLEGAIASFWAWIAEDPQGQASVTELGELLRALHDLLGRYPAQGDFPPWDPFAEIERRLHTLEQEGENSPPASELGDLRKWSRETANEVEAIDWQLQPGLIHGDAHVGNVLVAEDGTNFLIDFDGVARGRREWDLVPTAVSRLRFNGDRDSIVDFGAAYGFDLLGWSGWPAMRRLRELYMTSWLMTVANSEARRKEVSHRMRCLAEGDEQAIWHAK
jgi:Ser/Thr protein kinase RdoA (MazF antagonist)